MLGNTNEVSPRRPIFAVLLSVLAPGLGHVYAGSLKKGLLLSVFAFVALLNAGMMFDLSTFYATVLLRLGLVGFYLYVFISVFLLARKNKAYTLKKFNRWYIYLAMFVVLASLANVFVAHANSILGTTTFRIVSNSMAPTVQQGDFISVDTRYSVPVVGDVVVFVYPKDRSKDYVFRIAAIGGDTISIKDGIVTLNGQAESALNVAISRRQSKPSVSMDRLAIPEDEIFVLGDWRDNSNDSRYWGTVPVGDIVGKVRSIWFSKTRDRIGTEVE
ncbi:MAG: signal peptidase I [Granulosicoccaceae bacterium]